MKQPLPDSVLGQLFTEARTFNAFLDHPVDDDTLRRLHELCKWGPTSVNCQPARFLFIRSAEAKQRLKPALAESNRDKTMAAPVTAIVATDVRFHDQLPQQFPAMPGLRDLFEGNRAFADETRQRNGALQGAYLMMAARSLGLDCGPMSGFDAGAVNAEFFPDGRWEANFLVNLGWGAPSGTRPRGPRLPYETAVLIA